MKDVAQLRKASGSRLAGFDPKISEIGKPAEICLGAAQAEGTQRTETSQYLLEKKENSTPQVAASERGSAQTVAVQGCGRCCSGVVGPTGPTARAQGVTKRMSRRMAWEGQLQRVIAP